MTQETQQIERPAAPAVYERVAKAGEAELHRPTSALLWSSLAAGLSITFSVIAEGLLRAHLPEAPWRPLIENFGYCVGFLIVVLAHQQLFTENTITAVLPVLHRRKRADLGAMLRVWGIVYAGNMVGTFIAAFLILFTPIFAIEVVDAMLGISHHMMENSPIEMFSKGIVAGWLIASMVWLLPSSEGAEFWVIVLMTYLIALGDLTHIIAGSAEAFMLLLKGEIGIMAVLFEFMVPTLLGNVIGGSALFAMIAFYQVREEV